VITDNWSYIRSSHPRLRMAALRRPSNAIYVECTACIACGIRGGFWVPDMEWLELYVQSLTCIH